MKKINTAVENIGNTFSIVISLSVLIILKAILYIENDKKERGIFISKKHTIKI